VRTLFTGVLFAQHYVKVFTVMGFGVAAVRVLFEEAAIRAYVGG